MCNSSVSDSIELAVNRAALCVLQGGIVAFPTETYYGLAADPDCKMAVDRLFRIKGRHADQPLLLLVAEDEQLNQVVESVPLEYRPLMDKYWPGPLTLVFQAKSSVSSQVTGGTGTVGVRISSHPVARALVNKMGKPVTATSANISGMVPAKSALAVRKMFGSSLDYIVDGGETEGGLCSTIIGYKNRELTVFRQGPIEVLDNLAMF